MTWQMVKPCIQMIPHRTCWECSRCCTIWCQYCGIRFTLNMPPTCLYKVYDIALGKPLPMLGACPYHQLKHTTGIVPCQVQPWSARNLPTPVGKWHRKHRYNGEDVYLSLMSGMLNDTSYNVKALFTSVLLDLDITIIKRILEKDSELHKITSMSIHHIMTLLEFCLKNTCFLFKGPS